MLKHVKVNALDIELLESLTETLNELAASNSVGAVVLTGTGTVFSAGVDLKRLIAEPPAYLDRFFPALRKLFSSSPSCQVREEERSRCSLIPSCHPLSCAAPVDEQLLLDRLDNMTVRVAFSS